ncbi:MAG: PQQ-binding-like beta-propeller repeat protein [Limisphaerales bacterium]
MKLPLLPVLFATAGCLCAADWPEWRGGPERTAVWNDPTLPAALPKDGPKVLWKKTIGDGYSGPSVAAGRVCVMDRLKPPAAGEDTERVVCLDANDGHELWVCAYPCALKLRGGYENGPRATATVRDGKVYALGAMGNLHCLDAATGKILWSVDVVKDYHARLPNWGVANAPLVEGKLLVFQAGGQPDATVLALDKDTGKEIWRSLSDKPSYAPIIAINSGHQRQFIVWTGQSICSLNPANGQVFWRQPRACQYDEAVATPLFHQGLNLLLCCHDWSGTMAIQLEADKPGFNLAWTNSSISCLHSTPVIEGNHLYGLNHNSGQAEHQGEFRCVNLATGQMVWANTRLTQPRRWAQASLTLNAGNGVYYILTDLGELVLARCTPAGYEELSRAQLTGKTWSHPAFANHRIYARSETALLCATLE